MFNRSLFYSALVFSVLAVSSIGVASANGDDTDKVLTQSFPEDGGAANGWQFGWHGYARMPIRFSNGPLGRQEPDLVDDNYGQSGFSYLRINETEWVELALSAEKGRTRFVAGLFTDSLSAWSNESGAASTPAIAFIEHGVGTAQTIELTGRFGVFWRRLGYTEAYDTYLIGRTHLAGAQLHARLLDNFVLEAGAGGNAREDAFYGFGPTYWVSAGVEYPFAHVRGHRLATWNDDRYDAKQDFTSGHLKVTGFDASLAIPYVGQISYLFSFIQAQNVEFVGRGVEVLHSTSGNDLKINFLGSEENGTGEIQTQALDFTWELASSLKPLSSKAAKIARGLSLRLFGLSAFVATAHEQAELGDPGKNDRHYLKWGTDVVYEPPFAMMDWAFLGVRFDRVMTHTDHESLAFRVVSPRIGAELADGVEVFAQYSFYDYGDNVTFEFFDELEDKAKRSLNRDKGAVSPDDQVFKLQAQARW